MNFTHSQTFPQTFSKPWPTVVYMALQILKQDWPHKWKSFIPDIVGASKTSETLCENSMVILKLLSEEVFDFSRGELTQVRLVQALGSNSCTAHCPQISVPEGPLAFARII